MRVWDVESDYLNVTFYDSNGNVIGNVENVENNTYASVTWSGLTPCTWYSWYAKVYDNATNVNQTSNFTFKTSCQPIANSKDDYWIKVLRWYQPIYIDHDDTFHDTVNLTKEDYDVYLFFDDVPCGY